MGEMITKPDTNPIIIAVANFLVLGGLGYFLMGQKKKAIITWVVVLFGGFCTFGLLYMFVWVTAYDGYLLGQKLASGESIGETENGLSVLDMIFR